MRFLRSVRLLGAARTALVASNIEHPLGLPNVFVGARYAMPLAMSRRSTSLLHGDLTERVIGVYHDAHHEFGDGFLEVLCQRVMVIALQDAGLTVRQDMKFEVEFRGHNIGTFVPDIVVNDLVLVEIKSVPSLEPRHVAQAINYLRASTLEVALLLNFGPKREVERLIYTNDRKQDRGRTPNRSD